MTLPDRYKKLTKQHSNIIKDALKMYDALNRIAMLGSSEMAYTRDFTTKVNGIARKVLAEIEEQNK
jgi:hypothetical protein